MAISSTSWQAGQSGNPKGRTPRPRPGAEALITAGQQIDETTGEDRFSMLAGMIWEALLTGAIPIQGSEPLPISAREWIDLVKWLSKHVDGGLRPIPPAPTADDGRSQPEDDNFPTFGWTEEDYPAPPDHIDPMLNAPVSKTPQQPLQSTGDADSTDALPQLDSYLAQFSADVAASPTRPYITTEPIAQVENPELVRKLLLQVRTAHLAKNASTGAPTFL